jgi:hypothetical protein
MSDTTSTVEMESRRFSFHSYCWPRANELALILNVLIKNWWDYG